MAILARLIIFALVATSTWAAHIPRRYKANDVTTVYIGKLTDVRLPWNGDLANPASGYFGQQKGAYEANIKSALVAKDQNLYGNAQISVTEFSGHWISSTQTATTVNFVIGLPNAQPPATQVDSDLEQGAQLSKFSWRYVDVTDSGLPPLPEPDRSPGWTEAAQMFLSSIDFSVDPCQNFYNFACNNWIAKHPLGNLPSTGTFNDLQTAVFVNLTKAFEALGTRAEASETIKMVDQIYQACKTATGSSYPGATIPLSIAQEYGGWPILDPSWSYADVPNNIYWTIGDFFTRYGVPTLLTPQTEIDAKDIERHVLYLDEANLAIPADYYRQPNLTEQYQDLLRQSIYQMVKMINNDLDNATILPQIDRMVAIEYHLAMISVNGSDERNMSLGYNPFTISQAQQEFPEFDWNNFLTGLIHDVYPQDKPADLFNPFIIAEPRRYLRDLNDFVGEANRDPQKMRDLVNYLIFRLISPYMLFATDDFQAIYKELKRRTRIEEIEITDQEQQCVQYIANNIPYAAGRLYIDSSFPQANRDDVAVMINNVLSAFSSGLSGLQWMDNESALRAYQKVAGLVRNVAYPDWQQDDTQLDAYHQPLIDEVKKIDPKDTQAFYKYNAQVTVFNGQLVFWKLKQPTDRTEFGMSSAIVNAWYQPIRNSITFPAAILNQPFYRYDFPQAVNYGALGIVMGHELSHGFDDQGIQFDWNGTLNTWMTPHAEAGFDQMAQCVVDQYSHFCYPELQTCINGITTQGENIGDNGGIKAAYRAYQAYVASHGAEKPLPGLEQFTMNQIFFLAYGQVWCGEYSEDTLLRQLLTDAHSPGKDRVIGAIQNFPKFGEAYGCKKGDPMYPVNACDVW